MIVIRNLTHTYPGSRKQRPRNALIDLSLTVGTGDFCILSGPNGSGKSSLFRILCGLALPTSGSVSIGGHDLFKHPAAARAQTGVVFQSPAVDKYLSVLENLRLHASLHGIKGAELSRRLEEALAWTVLKDRLDDKVESLSGGMQRQVELAKVLLTRPRLLLLDEPTTGLDPAARRAFLDCLRRIHKEQGMTILMTTHIFAEAEDADRVAILKEGRLLAYDAPSVLRSRIGSEMVVVQSLDPIALEEKITTELGLPFRRVGEELRLEQHGNGESLPILEKILERYRPQILSISIKQPSLEDVFIHVTAGQDPATDAPALLKTGS